MPKVGSTNNSKKGVTVAFKMPKHYDYYEAFPTSERTCSHEDCESPAPYITGYYLVIARNVRVWTCLAHWSGNPRLVLPTPPDILAALKAEEVFLEKERKRLRYVDPERGVSIKTLAASGHGEPIPGDRVKNWRWGT